MSINRWIGIGRLVRDVELKYTPQGHAVATFTLAVERDFKPEGAEKREADFIDVVCWRKLAEVVANNLAKGRLVCVEGRIQVRSYETQDGHKRKATEIQASNVQFLDRGKAQDKPGDGGEEIPMGGDDIPF
ncbi:MAG: single-stranded DNA-binding protein [Pseudomonadota bacterium]